VTKRFGRIVKEKTQEPSPPNAFNPYYLWITYDLTRTARWMHLSFPRTGEWSRVAREEKMKGIKLSETEVFESNRVFDLPGGSVVMFERQIHEIYRPEKNSSTRLVISDAIDRTRTFVSKAREEFSELNSVMRELVAR
jgi:hypothetical protein